MAETRVTEMLAACREGDEEAFGRLVAVVYDDLRRMARRHRRGSGPTPTLDTTALVHEAYLKLAGGRSLDWNDRAHFLAVAARAMRHVVIDEARALQRVKRGGDAVRVELDESHLATERALDRLVAVDSSLRDLSETEPRLARVVECRFFAGMTTRETATALAISAATVERDWARAKVELRRRLEGD